MKYNTIALSMLTVGLLGSTALHAGDIEQNLPATADAFTVDANGAELMRVNGDGNVGIGSTNPPSKLTVVGLPNSSTVTGNKLGGRSIRITDNGSFYIPTVDTPPGYKVIYAGGHAWLDRNLGATQPATSWTGNTSASEGDLYQWGREKDGHESRTSGTQTTCATAVSGNGPNFVLTNNLTGLFNWNTVATNCNEIQLVTYSWSGLGATSNGVCPAGWRLPSRQDFEDLGLEGGIDGFNKLKLTAGGFRNHKTGGVGKAGVSGYYWTYSVDNDRSTAAYIYDNHMTFYPSFRANGLSVRCMKQLTE